MLQAMLIPYKKENFEGYIKLQKKKTKTLYKITKTLNQISAKIPFQQQPHIRNWQISLPTSLWTKSTKLDHNFNTMKIITYQPETAKPY